MYFVCSAVQRNKKLSVYRLFTRNEELDGIENATHNTFEKQTWTGYSFAL
jgi:hypothetical protein